MSWDIKDMIDEAVEMHRDTLPIDVRHAISDATLCLYEGPSVCNLGFDEACNVIREWAYTVDDVEGIVDYDEETDTETTETVYGSAEKIVRVIVGPELFPYIR